jgi:hypothetical protein
MSGDVCVGGGQRLSSNERQKAASTTFRSLHMLQTTLMAASVSHLHKCTSYSVLLAEPQISALPTTECML